MWLTVVVSVSACPDDSSGESVPNGRTEQVSDQFVDDLYAKLHAARQKTISDAAATTQTRERVVEAARSWWEEFSQVLERKVQAWNAKDPTGACLTYTQRPSGAVLLWHRSAEAELRLAETRVVLTGRLGDTQPRESPFIEFQEARGTVAAMLAGGAVKSPSEAADRLLEPIFTRAFAD